MFCVCEVIGIGFYKERPVELPFGVWGKFSAAEIFFQLTALPSSSKDH